MIPTELLGIGKEETSIRQFNKYCVHFVISISPISQFLLYIEFLAQIENSLMSNNIPLPILLFLFSPDSFLSLLDGKHLDIQKPCLATGMYLRSSRVSNLQIFLDSYGKSSIRASQPRFAFTICRIQVCKDSSIKMIQCIHRALRA